MPVWGLLLLESNFAASPRSISIPPVCSAFKPASLLFRLIPISLGVWRGSEFDGRSGAVNGARSDQTNVTLDGMDCNDPIKGYAFTCALRATQASLAEFRTTTTNYGADAGGRSSAAQVQLLTNRGTN